MQQPSTHILVLGGGVAGLLFTLRLSGKIAGSAVHITLVDEAETFVARPRLHEFATNQPIFSRPFSQILQKTQIKFVQGRVTALHPDQRRVTVLDQQQQQREMKYDFLVYALGSMTDRESIPGVEQYAYTLSAQGAHSASDLRARLPEIAAKGGRVVVCGAGSTGIETAAQVASVYPQIHVSLVTRGPLGHSWNQSVTEQIRRRLSSLSIEIIEQSTVCAVRSESVVLTKDELLPTGKELACDLCIWTTGFVVPSLAKEASVTVNERGQILVNPFLRSISHREIYAIGDAASPAENPGVPHVRMSAFTASIMGAHGADCLRAELTGKTPRPLSFAYLAQAISLGQHNALFLTLSPDDSARAPYIGGRAGALIREVFIKFIITATLAQRRFPGLFIWIGKRRYESFLLESQARVPGLSSLYQHKIE